MNLNGYTMFYAGSYIFTSSFLALAYFYGKEAVHKPALENIVASATGVGLACVTTWYRMRVRNEQRVDEQRLKKDCGKIASLEEQVQELQKEEKQEEENDNPYNLHYGPFSE